MVDKQVLAGIIRGDESETLVVAEPLDGSCCHVAFLQLRALRTTEGAESNDCGDAGHYERIERMLDQRLTIAQRSPGSSPAVMCRPRVTAPFWLACSGFSGGATVEQQVAFACEVPLSDAADLFRHPLRRPWKELDVTESTLGFADPPPQRKANAFPRIRSTSSSATVRTGGLVKSSRERAEEKRESKLETVREQLQSGSLTIRQMTDEERRRYPPRPAGAKRSGRR